MQRFLHMANVRGPVSLDVLGDGHEDFGHGNVASGQEVPDRGDEHRCAFLRRG